MGFHSDTLQLFPNFEPTRYLAYCARIRAKAEALRSEGVRFEKPSTHSTKPKGAKRWTKLPWRVAGYFDTDEAEEKLAKGFRGLYSRLGNYYYFEYLEDAMLLHLAWI